MLLSGLLAGLAPQVLSAFDWDPTFGSSGLVVPRLDPGGVYAGDLHATASGYDVALSIRYGSPTVERRLRVSPDGVLADGERERDVYVPTGITRPNSALDFETGAGGHAYALFNASRTDIVLDPSPPGPARVRLARFDSRGELDPGWNGHGFVDLGSDRYDHTFFDEIAVDRSGAIYVASAHVEDSTREVVVYRVGADGRLDASWGQAGVVRLAGASCFEVPRMTLDQHDRLIVLVPGRACSAAAGLPYLVRLDHQGVPDEAFADAGTLALHEFGTTSYPSFLRLHADRNDRVLLARMKSAGSIELVRVTPDGRIDDAWGDAGIARLPLPAGSLVNDVTGLVVDDQDRVVVATHLFEFAPFESQLLRATPQGEPDPTFGVGGAATLPKNRMPIAGSDPVISADGRILVLASHGAWQAAELVALREDGSSDEEFAPDGIALLDVGNGGGASEVLRCGETIHVAARLGRSAGVFALSGDGTLDSSFAVDGYARLPAPFILSHYVEDASRDADGGYVFALRPQNISPVVSLFRIDATGRLDSAFGSGGESRFHTGGFWATRLKLASDGARTLLAFDQRPSGDLATPMIAAFDGRGALDRIYGTSGIFRSNVVGRISELDEFHARPGGGAMLWLDHFDPPLARAGLLLPVDAEGRPDPVAGPTERIAVSRFTTAIGDLEVWDILPLRDGSTLGFGSVAGHGSVFRAVARLDPEGRFDRTFAGGVGYRLINGRDFQNIVGQHPSDRIIVLSPSGERLGALTIESFDPDGSDPMQHALAAPMPGAGHLDPLSMSFDQRGRLCLAASVGGQVAVGRLEDTAPIEIGTPLLGNEKPASAAPHPYVPAIELRATPRIGSNVASEARNSINL